MDRKTMRISHPDLYYLAEWAEQRRRHWAELREKWRLAGMFDELLEQMYLGSVGELQNVETLCEERAERLSREFEKAQMVMDFSSGKTQENGRGR